MKKYRLLLSVLVASTLVIAGGVYAHDGGGGDGWHQHGECRMSRLPEEKMKLLHDAMKASFEKDKPLHEQAHKLHEELHGIMAASAFNEKAYMTTEAKLEDIHARISRDRTAAFASVAGKFTPEEREELMKMIHEHRQDHHHGHHGWGGHEGHEWHHDHGDESGVNGGQTNGTSPDYPPSTPR